MLAPCLASGVSRGLWAPDEPRYAEVAREIYERGDFLVMHLCGEVYPDKPPLLFWLAGLLGWLGGWSVPLMRLVSIAAAAGTAALTARLARRELGPREAAWAPVVFLSMLLVSELSGRLQIDPLLAFLCTAAIACGSAAPGASVPRRNVLAAGTLAGLAGLAKGPVAWVVIGLVLGAWRFLSPPPSVRTSRTTLLVAAALAVAPVLAWALAAAAVEPRLWAELFWGQHAERAVSGERHGGPPWKHLVDMPLLMLPWTLPVLLGARAAWRSLRGKTAADPGVVRAAAWLAAPFLFFSLIPAKRDLYLLPAYPAAALLAARWLVSAGASREHTAAAWLAAASLAAPGAALLAAPFLGPSLAAAFGEELPAALGARAAMAGLSLLAGGAWVVHQWARAPALAWARALAQAWAGAVSLALLVLLPALDPLKSGRVLALALAARPERPAAIECFGVRPEAYRFYGGVPARAGRSLAAALEREGSELLALVRAENWARLPLPLKSRLRVLDEARVGSRTILVVGAAVRGSSARDDDAEAGTAER
jgi:4-amino-4-deoxy-L-arabinose transferase-like glycosyltransferase